MVKLKAGDWVTIVKSELLNMSERVEYYQQFVGMSVPVLEVELLEEMHCYLLPIPAHCSPEPTWWFDDDVRLATKAEIKKWMPHYVAQQI